MLSGTFFLIDKLSFPFCRPSKKTASSALSEDEFIAQLKETYNLHLYNIILLDGLDGFLRAIDYEGFTQSPESVIITVGQLKAGLRLPIYNPDNPFIYEVWCQIRPQRALTQWSGNAFRVVLGWEGRSRGIDCITSDITSYSPEDAPLYTVKNFIQNYHSGTSTNGELAGFSASPHRHRSMPPGVARMMLDADPMGRAGNKLPRKSNDPYWDEIPLLVNGPILHGNFPAPPNPKAYPFWVIQRDVKV